MFKRSAGVFLNISSLPSKYGIGDFGEGARQFIDRIRQMGFSVWQTLPLCPVGSGNSPYSSPSAFAVNPLYVDPDGLVEMGLISPAAAEAAVYPGEPYAVDYAFVKESKTKLLREAFAAADPAAVSAFREANAFWLPDYAKYMAGKAVNDQRPFWEWTAEAPASDVDYYCFEQYILFTQWERLRAHAKERGIAFFGDMPIYVSRDSADFMANPQLFLTGPDGRLTKVAGVPPDYFSADGQLWGNPLYDWAEMEKDGYRWWLERIGQSFRLFDIVRIDHFRGFHRFWAVDAAAETAREGEWLDGPGMKLFRAVEKAFPNADIVAEDLGTVDAPFLEFLAETGYPGMKVIQFGFTSDDSDHLPHKYLPNCVAYTGTHDNDTMLGWLWAIPMAEKLRLLEYCRYPGSNWGEGGPRSEVIHSIITTLWQTAAGLTMIPVQDMCGYGTDTRLNIPGKAEGNWQFRITENALKTIDADFFSGLNRIYKR